MSGVCPQCARRSWLLEELRVSLDFGAREHSRLWELLQLADTDLIEAIGGRRRQELHAAYAQWQPLPEPTDAYSETLCRHHAAYPRSLSESRLAPHVLGVRGRFERLTRMLDKPVVAIVGTRRASDYGMETARGLARGLAASGLTVASGLDEGIAAAAHSGALEASGTTLTVLAGDMKRCSPAWCNALYRRITNSGCAISETPWSPRAWRWSERARARTLALLAQLVIVVEARERPWELACAYATQMLGRPLAAVPGRVCSPTSSGTNSLLLGGARLVRCPQDALDLLYGVGVRQESDSALELEPRLQTFLEQVGEGWDTIAKLIARGSEVSATATALTELELMGLLVRGDGGRYLPSGVGPSLQVQACVGVPGQ